MTTVLVIALIVALAANIAVERYLAARRADKPLTAKRVRVFTKPYLDGTDDTVEGTLVGVRAGHYLLIHAVALEAPGADGTPLDGEVWLPAENVRTIQVLAS